jgi:hypothetical protein
MTGAAGGTVSTTNVTPVAAGETLPAGSCCVATIVWIPSTNVDGTQFHVPPATTAVHRTVGPSVTVTVAPFSPVPVTAGVASATVDPLSGAVMTGAGGAAVSTVKLTGVLSAETLPAASRCVAVIVYGPSARVTEVHDQEPPTTVAVHSVVGPSATVTVAPVSPVPATPGVASLVWSPSTGAVMTGAPGTVASTVKVTAALAGDMFPLASCCVAVIVCDPSASIGGRQDQAPVASTTAVHTVVAPSSTVTVAPSSPAPVMVGDASLVTEPFAGAVMLGATGGTVSTVNVTAPLAGEVLPAASRCVAVMVCDPSANVEDGQDHVPPATTTAVQSVAAPSTTMTVAAGSPVPVNVGVALVMPAPLAGAVITGASGAAVSTVNVTGALGADTLSAASRWVAVMVCDPSNNVDERQDQAPALTTALHSVAPFSATTTVAASSPVPAMAGLGSASTDPPAGTVMTGGAGGTVSTVNVTGALAGETLPATSRWDAVMVWSPSGSGAGVQLQFTPATVAVHSVVAPWSTVTTAPSSPVPAITGLGSDPIEPWVGA